MQMTYVFTELKQGLRRNVSMHLAVVLTLVVSLTLVGLGALLTKQADHADSHFGKLNQVVVWLCNDASESATCTGAVTPAEKTAILDKIKQSSEVSGFHVESQQTAFEKTKELFGRQYKTQLPSDFGAKDLRESVWIDLKKGASGEGIMSEVKGLDGVWDLRDSRDLVGKIFEALNRLKLGSFVVALVLLVAALLLVANTIRLAAFARRREIGIMRLVGAGTLYIMLPFLLEAVVTAAIGVVIAIGALSVVEYFFVENYLAGLQFMPWVDWSDVLFAAEIVAIAGPVLTILPTLLLTRKYTKV